VICMRPGPPLGAGAPGLPFPSREIRVRLPDGTEIRCVHAGRGRRRLALLAHPAVTGLCYPPLLELAATLHEDFDVALFDFRGHGGSGGRCSFDPLGPAADLHAVTRVFRGSGYDWVGAVGFSLGGMAAIVAGARWRGLDAVVSVGAPPRLPDLRRLVGHPRAARALLRLLGARFSLEGTPVLIPLEAVPHLSPTPLLLVHGEKDFTYPRHEFERMWEAAGRPKQRLVLPEAGHAELAGHHRAVAGWLLGAAG